MRKLTPRFLGIVVSFAILAVTLVCSPIAAQASIDPDCMLDWNGDDIITQEDYLIGDPMGGYYAEWYIYVFYPTYYPILFPDDIATDLDLNGDGVVDMTDLMAPLDAAAETEGFYTAWYIYMYYPLYISIFIPECTDCQSGICALFEFGCSPDHEYVDAYPIGLGCSDDARERCCIGKQECLDQPAGNCVAGIACPEGTLPRGEFRCDGANVQCCI